MRLESVHELLAQFPDVQRTWSGDTLPEIENELTAKLPTIPVDEWELDDLVTLTQLARAQGLQGKILEARAALSRVDAELAKHEEPAAERLRVRYLLEMGRLHCLEMKPSQAQSLFKEAWDISTQKKDFFFAIDAALMSTLFRHPKQQFENLQWAIKQAEDKNNAESALWLPNLYLMKAWHYFDLRNFKEAMVWFDRALIHPATLPAQALMIKWGQARTMRDLGQLKEAIDLLSALLASYEAEGQTNGFVHLELAENLRLLGMTDEARVHFEKAHEELLKNPWYVDNKGSNLNRIKEIFKKKY